MLRLLDRGDFVAQATLTTWKKDEPGKHMSIDEFKAAITSSANWETEEIAESAGVPSDDGRLY